MCNCISYSIKQLTSQNDDWWSLIDTGTEMNKENNNGSY